MLCLATGGIVATLAVSSFSLVWNHSIEKIRWEEDWRIEDNLLVLTTARIRGTGAGMEVPDGAVLLAGVWHYRPKLAPLPKLQLTHTPYTSGYDICHGGHCQPLAEYLPGLDNSTVIEIRSCRQ
jgi:hypothetical protein